MTLDQLHPNVVSWAFARKILKNGQPYTQQMKLISEWGETCDALAKGKEKDLKDGIGDSSVVLCILAEMAGFTPKIASDVMAGFTERRLVHFITCTIGGLVNSGAPDRAYSFRICSALAALQQLAVVKGLDYGDCLAEAWAEIKDRKGELNENGVFIKEADL